MPGATSPMVTGNVFIAPEVKANFLMGMEPSERGIGKAIDRLVEKQAMGARLEKYGYWEFKGNPRRFEQGTTRPRITAQQRMYLLSLHLWGAEAVWSVFDERDAPNAPIKSIADMLALRHRYLRPRVFTQVIEGTTNSALKDVIETAVDGLSLFNSSTTRGGITGGNIETIAEITDHLTAYNAILACHRRFIRFKQLDSINPLLGEDEYSEMDVMYPLDLHISMQEVAKQVNRLAIGGTDAGASVENLLAGSKVVKLNFVPNPYLTDASDIYCFLPNGRNKAILEGFKEGYEVFMHNPTTSKECSREMIESLETDERFNMRAHFWQYAVKGNVA